MKNPTLSEHEGVNMTKNNPTDQRDAIIADLLTVAHEALWRLSSGTEGKTMYRSDEMLPMLRAAIAKAEGREEEWASN